MTRVRFGVIYDFRKVPGSKISMPDLYEQSLDQAERIDDLGYDHVWLTEHHFVDDGYLPSPLTVSGALAARTRNVMIGQDVLLLPHYHPVRLAEDLAVLDNLSRGRMMLGVGMGYVPAEFAALGSNRNQRLSRMEEGLDILELAWREERFDYDGKRYRLSDVRIHPRPVQAGGPPTWIAAMSEAGARRAARRGAHLLPQGDRAAVLDPFLEDVGEGGEERRIGIVRHFLVTEDAGLRAAFQDRKSVFTDDSYISKKYQEWFAQIDDAMTHQLAQGEEHGRTIPQSTFAGDPDECIREIESFTREFSITDVVLAGWGTPSGDDPTASTSNLERFAREVMPHFR